MGNGSLVGTDLEAVAVAGTVAAGTVVRIVATEIAVGTAVMEKMAAVAGVVAA